MQQINSKWFKNLNIRHDTIKPLEENMGKTFSDINHGSVFLGHSPKPTEIKAKINKWDLMNFGKDPESGCLFSPDLRVSNSETIYLALEVKLIFKWSAFSYGLFWYLTEI